MLDSWNAADHPDQRRLRIYLDEVEALINACVPATSDHLALELIVGLSEAVDLLSGGRDLDNYVSPIARRADPNRFDAVFVRKRYADFSTIVAAPSARENHPPGKPQLRLRTTVSAGSLAWKQEIHDACGLVVDAPLPSGGVSLCIRFGVASRRTWSNLWKPAIDSLGPLLGTDDPLKRFRPRDDRIVDLSLHRTIDESLGDAVEIDVWWQHSIG